MANPLYTPYTWNGTAIDGSGLISANFLTDNAPIDTRRVEAVESAIVGRGSVDVRAQPKPSVWMLRCKLSSVSEANQATLLSLFNEEGNSAWLVAKDSASTQWRVSARVLWTERVPGRFDFFNVYLRVANPVWEENSANTNTQTAMSGAGATFSVTNAGTRNCRPRFTITPNSLKTDCIDDWKYSFRGFVVNKSFNALSDYPVYLFDSAGAAGRLNLSTIARDISISNQINQVGGINATVTTIPIDTSVGGGLPARGGAWLDNEQIYYTGNTGTSLTGVVRAIGGTTASIHNDNVVIYKAEAQASGNDLTVWLNGVQTPRDVIGWSSYAATAVDTIVNMSLPPAAQDASGNYPLAVRVAAADTTIYIPMGGIENMPDSGFAVLNFASPEVIYYAGKSGNSLTGVVRALWGTSSSTATTVSIYPNPVHVVVAVGKMSASYPQTLFSTRPCFQGPGSSNQTWKYGDQTDDSQSVFYDPNSPDRTAQWVPAYEEDGNTGKVLVAMISSSNVVTFADSDVGEGKLPYNTLTLDLPQGTTASGNLTADWTPSAEILNSEMWGKDSGGNWKLIDQLQQAAAAPARNYALSQSLSGVKVKGRYNIAEGHRFLGSSETMSATEIALAQKFRLSQDVHLMGYLLYVKVNSAGTATPSISIFEDASNFAPGLAAALGSANLANLLPVISGSVSINNTSWGWLKISFITPILLRAGSYVMHMGRSGTPEISWGLGGNYDKPALISDATNFLKVPSGAGFSFQLIGTYDEARNALISDTQPVLSDAGARTATTVSFDKLIIPLLNSPLVHRTGTLTNGLYHCNAVIMDSTTGDSITVDRWMETGSTLVIDCETRTVTHTEETITYACPQSITPSDVGDWLPLAAGSNSINYAEANLISTTLATSWRGAKV